jgi:hypothetical protein
MKKGADQQIGAPRETLSQQRRRQIMSEQNLQTALEGASNAVDTTEETPKHPITDADPEGDGLVKGQTTADTVGDVLGI